MGYPGDQGRPGGWSTDPPSAPFGPGGEAEGQDDSPFAPRPGEFAARPGEQSGASPSDPFGPPAGSSAVSRAGSSAPWEQDSASSFGPGSFGAEAPFGQGGPGAPGAPGQFDAPDELYGSTGERYFSADGGAGGGGGYDELGNGRAPGGGPAGPSYPERRNNLPLIIGGAIVAGIVLIGGGFGVSTLFKDDEKKPGPGKSASQNQAAPKQKTLPPPGPLNAKLVSRVTDPKPLTLSEVFGKRTFAGAGQKYVRTTWRVDRSCAKAVNGTKLVAALKKGGCTQVLRATFARADGKLIGTVGVLNLKNQAAARNAVKAGAGRDAYLQPLAGTGTTKKIGKGDALGTARVRGHYLLMTWVQRPDGKTIAKKYHGTVTAFGQQVILGSNLSRALSFRGIEGKPFTG